MVFVIKLEMRGHQHAHQIPNTRPKRASVQDSISANANSDRRDYRKGCCHQSKPARLRKYPAACVLIFMVFCERLTFLFMFYSFWGWVGRVVPKSEKQSSFFRQYRELLGHFLGHFGTILGQLWYNFGTSCVHFRLYYGHFCGFGDVMMVLMQN